MPIQNARTPSRLTLAIAAIVLAQAVQAAEQQTGLEEITVTAQKREQSLRDVPLSVNVVDAERLATGNINKLADLVEFVPNLSMTETGISTQLYIRGIGSANNQGFEQSVGQYVDGVYYGRQMLMRAPFLDIVRIEVLRGPQSTLFGKNTIGGAINYTTARPTDEEEVNLYALREFESNQTELTGIVSGPLSDNVRARLALRSYQEDGYIQNTFKNTDEPQRDEDTYRLTVDWDITQDLTASLKLERNDFQTAGRQMEIVKDAPNLFPAGSTPIAGMTAAQVLRAFGQPSMDSELDFKRQSNNPENSDSQIENQTLTLEYNLGDLTLTSITAHLSYEFDELCDCDLTPANSFTVRVGENYSQLSQELRLSSPTGGKFEWISGAYFHDAEMTSLEALEIPADSFLRTLALASSDPTRRALAAVAGTRLWRDNGQDSKTSAAFFEGTWNIRDDLRLSLGGRYTREDKWGYRSLNVFDIATNAPTVSAQAPLVYLGAFRIYSRQLAGRTIAPGVVAPDHNLSGDRKEDQFTPMMNVEWDINDQTMLYASATSGYKAGGFDGRANNPFSFEFEDEKAQAYEMGSKSLLFNGAVELNAAYFFTYYQNLQVSQFDGGFGFNVGNAKEAEVQGLELDGRWAMTDDLTLSYSYAWLDFEFTDFSNGNCYNRQVPDGDIVNGNRVCNYTGKGGQYTPKNSASLAFDYTRAVTSGINFVGSLMLNYRSEQQVHDNQDPNMVIDAVNRVNLRLGLAGDKWLAAFVGKNLTNEKVLTYAANVPLSAS